MKTTIQFPLVPAGSVLTHLGLLLAHQCCSDTRGLHFTHFAGEHTAATHQIDRQTNHKLESNDFYIFLCPVSVYFTPFYPSTLYLSAALV